MFHGAKSCIVLVLHRVDFGEISLLMTIENFVNVNQMHFVVFVCDIKFPDILVNDLFFFFQCLLVMLPFPEQIGEEV